MQLVKESSLKLITRAKLRLRIAPLCLFLPLLMITLSTISLTRQVAAQNPSTSELNSAAPDQNTSKVGETSHKSAHKKRHTKLELKAEEEKKRVTVPIPEPEDPGPAYPVDAKAQKAEISWNSNGLRIEATNSSLKEILAEITTETGITVDGLNADQRIYGVYGPGRAIDVLGLLLEGTGYNVLMIGEQGPGTPRQVVLSVRGANSKSETSAVNQRTVQQPVEEEPEPDVPEETQNPQPLRPGFRQPAHPQPDQPNQPQNGQPNLPNQPNQQQPN